MSQLHVPNSTNAIDRSRGGNNDGGGSFKAYWSAFFTDIAKRLNGGAAVAQVTSPDATDLATAITLANETKAKLNALLTALNS
jgi:hypothetical protein